jgi:hypothetical protein
LDMDMDMYWKRVNVFFLFFFSSFFLNCIELIYENETYNCYIRYFCPFPRFPDLPLLHMHSPYVLCTIDICCTPYSVHHIVIFVGEQKQYPSVYQAALFSMST